MDFWKNGFLTATGLLLATASVRADFYAHASATETNVFLGLVFNLDVIVKAEEKPTSPDLGHLADFNVTLLDAGQATSGTNAWLYRYALRAKCEGTVTKTYFKFK